LFVLDEGPILFLRATALGCAFRSEAPMIPARLFVALIDDDESVRKALTRLLRASGHEVQAFASGAEFLASARAEGADCLVLDVHMPSISGLDVQAALRARDVHVPIVFITAYDDKGLRERALAQGAAAFLRKPLTEQTLLTAIARAAGSVRMA
jgi:FixJ family two-component response regulator